MANSMSNDLPTHFSRHQGLGGSDIAAVFGLSPFKSPVQLWAEKRQLPQRQADPQGLHLRLGQHLEPFIAKEFERDTGLSTHHHLQAFVHPDYPMFYGHIDRFITAPGAALWDDSGRLCASGILECKSAHAFARNQWGEAGSDQMPAAYLLQVVWYLALTGVENATVAVLLGNQEVTYYAVRRDHALEALVLAKAKAFWDEHIVAGVPPAARGLDDVRLIYPESSPERGLEADATLHAQLEHFRSLQASISELEAQAHAVKTEILTAMGKAETLHYRGQVLATWKQSRASQRIDLEALQAAYPEVVAGFKRTVPGSRRFLLKAPSPAVPSVSTPPHTLTPIAKHKHSSAFECRLQAHDHVQTA